MYDSKKETKNDIAWNKLFEKYEILKKIQSSGFYEIMATVINEFREARLMAKFDHKSQLPQIFTANNLSILPISRGGYIISDFEIFQDFDDNGIKIEKINPPNYLESIDFNNITSEAIALNCAYASGIIQDFVQDEELKPTISGRMNSGKFDFRINFKSPSNPIINVGVDNAQIEIDGGYEGIESLSLIEAKNIISKDFLIRQLFYPFRLWSSKISKKIRPLFLTYSNGIFHFREYQFQDPEHYNSLKLLREKKYSIHNNSNNDIINLEIIQKILHQTKSVPEPKIPFPQADSFKRIINLCELLNEKKLTHEYITSNYDFDRRQTEYYTNAAIYLDLVKKDKENQESIYTLTNRAKEIFKSNFYDRQIKFIEAILSHSVFKETLECYLKKREPPNKDEVVTIMKRSHLYNVTSDETFKRRSSTVISWINWILDQRE